MFIVIDRDREQHHEFDTLQEATDFLLHQERNREYFDSDLFEAKQIHFEVEKNIVVNSE